MAKSTGIDLILACQSLSYVLTEDPMYSMASDDKNPQYDTARRDDAPEYATARRDDPVIVIVLDTKSILKFIL